MKNSWQFLTLLLAVALVALSITVSKLSSKIDANQSVEASPVDKEQIILESIMSRSSVRAYTEQEVEKSKIETILKAGMAAPTAGNRQPWEFVVVTEREILDKFPPVIPGAHMAAKAKLAIVVCGDPSKSFAAPLSEYWVQDCSAATENILLAAHAMGLGAVWCGAYPNDKNDRVAKMREILSLPDNLYALSIIVIGYPSGEPTVKDKWDPAKVHYNKY
ncbi:MAG: nitroreductase family protein [Rikenellaceae bacterium]